MSYTEPVIEINDFTKDYEVGFLKKKTVRALDHLSLEVRRGEIFGFLGPNGAGKTTTLKLLMRLIFPTAGNAKIFGKPIEDSSTRALIGYLPENPYFYDYLSGRELLEYSAALFGIPKAQAADRVTTLLQRVGLEEEQANRQLRKYSKGMLQRIGIAQALINEPEIIFMDEPMSGLDPIGRREIRDLMLSLRDHQRTIFFSSHILSDVEALCDRAAILRKGKLVKCGTLRELADNEDPSFEIVSEGIHETGVASLSQALPDIRSMTQVANQLHLVLREESSIEETIKAIHQFGGRVLSINPRRTSLEDIFSNREKGNPS